MKTIFKTECRIRRKLNQNIITVLDTHSYEEIELFGVNDDYITETVKAMDKLFYDDLKPLRFFSFNNDNLYVLIQGEDTVLSKSELLVVLINSLLSCNINEFKISLSGKDTVEVAKLLQEYDLFDYICPSDNTLDEFKFEVINVTDGKILAVGYDEQNTVYFKLDCENLVEALYNKEDIKDTLLPVAVVGSQSPAYRHKVAFGLRTQGLKIEEYIGNGTMTDMLEYTELKGIAVSIWADGENILMKNMKTGERSETTISRLLGEK